MSQPPGHFLSLGSCSLWQVKREEARLVGNEAVFLPLEPPPTLIQAEGKGKVSTIHPIHRRGPPAPRLPHPRAAHSYGAGKQGKNSDQDIILLEAVRSSSPAGRVGEWREPLKLLFLLHPGGRWGGGADVNELVRGTLGVSGHLHRNPEGGSPSPPFTDGNTEAPRDCSGRELWWGSELKLVLHPSLLTQREWDKWVPVPVF